MILILFFLVSAGLSGADDIVRPTPSPDFDSFFPKPSRDARTDVQRELECIQFRTQDAKEPLKTSQATQMVKLLAPHLESGFRRFGIPPFERAFFYAQSIEESGGFTQLSESRQFVSRGTDPLAHLIANDANDARFHAKKNATHSRQFGVYRGRGLIQISRCDNYLSVVDYLNQMSAGREPKWRSNWKYVPAGKTKDESEPIGAVCSKKELDLFKSQYRAATGWNANLYGVLDDPMHFSMIGAEYADPVSGHKTSSEQFMVDASLAYWRGRCGEIAANAADKNRLADYPPCARFAGGDYLSHAVKCLTYCVKGSTEGWQQRKAWMEQALLCGRL